MVTRRFWIELGFKAIRSLGWKWDKTRRTDPTPVSRQWLVLSVVTLLAPAYGTRVEDAQDRGITPDNLRAPPKSLAPNHQDPRTRPARTVRVTRRRQQLAEVVTAQRSCPEPCPAAPLTLAVTQVQLGDHPSCAVVTAVTYPCQLPAFAMR